MRTYDCEQTNRVTSWAYPGTDTTENIQLPRLSINDIAKLDQLLLFMKEKQTTYTNVFLFCKEKWGDNKPLYLYFSEYLRKNSFTSAPNNTNGIEYAWGQKITKRGLALDSFKKEYIRQRENKKSFIKSQKRVEHRPNFSYTITLYIRNFILSMIDLRLGQ